MSLFLRRLPDYHEYPIFLLPRACSYSYFSCVTSLVKNGKRCMWAWIRKPRSVDSTIANALNSVSRPIPQTMVCVSISSQKLITLTSPCPRPSGHLVVDTLLCFLPYYSPVASEWSQVSPRISPDADDALPPVFVFLCVSFLSFLLLARTFLILGSCFIVLIFPITALSLLSYRISLLYRKLRPPPRRCPRVLTMLWYASVSCFTLLCCMRKSRWKCGEGSVRDSNCAGSAIAAYLIFVN